MHREKCSFPTEAVVNWFDISLTGISVLGNSTFRVYKNEFGFLTVLNGDRLMRTFYNMQKSQSLPSP